jgi:hypothetical protein
MARDIGHVWTATNHFSASLPVYMGQMAQYLSRTAKDAFTRSGRYRDFIEEGGGMNFLTQQGTDLFATIRPSQLHAEFGLNLKWQRVKQALSYVNETSEIWVRMALRERVLDNQKAKGLAPDSLAATHAARTYLDFSQGGKSLKAIDTFTPYLNAGTQALRTVSREVMKHPAESAMKFGQIAAMDMALRHMNYLGFPELMKDLQDWVKADYFILGSPFSFTDEFGNIRHAYVRLKKEETVYPIVNVLSFAVDRLHTGRAPDRDVFDEVLDAVPFTGNLLKAPFPLMQAVREYAANYNFFTDDTIWRGRSGVHASAEFIPGLHDPIFVDAAQGLSRLGVEASPARMQAAVS